MGEMEDAAAKVADLIDEHRAELVETILDAYDKRYYYSKGNSLPQEMREAWTDAIIDGFVDDFRGASDPNKYQAFGGDMVLLCEKSVNSYVTFLEGELFYARVISTFLWRHWVGDPVLLKAGIDALEECIRKSIEANTVNFIEELCAPGTITRILSLKTPSGPDYEASSAATASSKDQESGSGYTETTQREREVLNLIVRGCSNKEISARLGISVSTVKHHIGHIFVKYNVQSRTELVAAVLRE